MSVTKSTQTETIVEDEQYTIEWDDDIEAVVHTWEEFTTGEDFREGSEELLEAIRARGARRMLVDTRGIRAHDEEDQEWLQSEWTPRVVDAGVGAAAVVHPDSVISEMDVEAVMEEINERIDGYETMFTSDESEAREWIRGR